MNTIENEFHFLNQGSFYNGERTELLKKKKKKKKKNADGSFAFLNHIDKTRWLLLQENREILLALGSYIHYCFEKRCKSAKKIFSIRFSDRRCTVIIH